MNDPKVTMDVSHREDISVEYLAREAHGAIEVEEAGDCRPLFVTIVGPIRYWWGREGGVPIFGNPRHTEYIRWRDAVEALLVKEGCLLFLPYKGVRGRWHRGAQVVNDAAIVNSNLIVDLRPPGIPADGTEREVGLAISNGVVVYPLPPAGGAELERLVVFIRYFQAARSKHEWIEGR